MNSLLSLKQASILASKRLNKNVTIANISYLVQYGVVAKIIEDGNTYIQKDELLKYYENYFFAVKNNFKNNSKNINWHLAFDNLKETETTKHVHRLHPYKGKFIPQLAQYFLDSNTDNFKKEIFFKNNDIVLDPFCGSGTTLVQANELGINAIGVDISEFNSIISNSKIGSYSTEILQFECKKIADALNTPKNILEFDKELSNSLNIFNKEYFTDIDFKYKIRHNIINEYEYAVDKEEKFLIVYNKLISKYNIKLENQTTDTFIERWTNNIIFNEIQTVLNSIEKINDKTIKEIVTLILSRTLRSCRATTHSDLTTLKKPVFTTYYCSKHGKICKPLFSIQKWFNFYYKDTIGRLLYFSKIKTSTSQICLTADSRNVNIEKELKKYSTPLYNLLKKEKISGIFSSPPYLGLIDYHEQHAYAYELFNIKRNDDLEIDPLSGGTGAKAKEDYINGISEVLKNSKKYLTKDYNVFLVANDKYNLYQEIADRVNMKIVNIYNRPVLNRSERDKNTYSESIFHLKEKYLS